MRLISAIILLAAIASASFAARPYVLVLGTGQDAGVPQMGCVSKFCQKAWMNPALRQQVSSIALVDPSTRARWIFDATPDLPEQFQFLKGRTRDTTNRIDGIFLTHAHIGHYTGLMYLGRESMNTGGIPVYAMPRMKQMLELNAPWSQLVALKNVLIKPLSAETEFGLNASLRVTPMLVPHRDEFSETVGFRISSDKKSLIYIPDIDKWQKWTKNLADIVRSADYLLIDGTFYADGEISRPMSEVPHPFVAETMHLLESLPRKEKSKVYFIHFNHSNPLVQGNRKALAEVQANGFRIAKRGLRLTL